MPVLLQMIPASWKKEFETQFRASGANKTYDALASQLMGLGNEERCKEGRGVNDMDVDAADPVEKDAENDDYTEEQ